MSPDTRKVRALGSLPQSGSATPRRTGTLTPSQMRHWPERADVRPPTNQPPAQRYLLRTDVTPGRSKGGL